MKVCSRDLCALHPTGEVLPLEDRGIRGTLSIQSTPQAKPGPWKWDLWGSQLITAPIEVGPTFYTGKSQRVPTAWAIWRSKGLWKALHKCLWKRQLHSLQVGHLAEDAPTSLVIGGYQRARDIKWPFLVRKLQYQASRLNLRPLLCETQQTIYQSIIVSSRSHQN